MANLLERWILHDFGTLQFVVDSFARQVIQVHGPGAITSDGPWQLCVDGGSQQLVSLDDETDATAAVETLATLVVEQDSSSEIVVRKDKTGCDQKVRLNAWQDLHRHEMESKFLEIPVENFEAFKCDFFGQRPRQCAATSQLYSG